MEKLITSSPVDTKSRPLVSIIIVNWNSKEYICKCIDCIKKQDYCGEIEVIVVDNGSTDGSVETIKENYPWVKLIENKRNLGFAAANNIGIRCCKGDYVCLVNSDVYMDKSCIRRLIDFIESHSNVGIAAPKLLNLDGSIQLTCKRHPSLWRIFCEAVGFHRVFTRVEILNGNEITDLNFDSPREMEVIAGAFWVIKREIFDKVGLLDEQFFFYGEDVDFCYRIRKAGFKIFFVPNTFAYHVGGGSSKPHSWKFRKLLLEAKLKFLRKYNSRHKQRLFLLIIMLGSLIRFSICYVKRGKDKDDFCSNMLRTFKWCLSKFPATTEKNK